jgi:hypothetical protein
MRWMKWLGVGGGILLIISCFTTWVFIASKSITVTGVDAEGTNFGKPGYLHFLLTFFFLVFTLVPRVWAKRANLLVVALNLAWAIRNYFMISACRFGDCPEKHTGLYLVIIASVIMFVSALFPDMKSEETLKKE